MSYKTVVTEDRRLAILRFLQEEGDYAMNDSVMQKALRQIGHGTSRDVVRSDFSWLAELGLIALERVMDDLFVANISPRGIEVATGMARVSGVSRPSPKSF